MRKIIAAVVLACVPAVAQAQQLFEELVPFQRWPVLPGKKVGLLLVPDSHWGVSAGWLRIAWEVGRPLAGYGTYQFMTDGASPWAVYFESGGEGHNFLKDWSVPQADGKPFRVDAAAYLPSTKNSWGLHEMAHLVEVEVNRGKGAASGVHFVVTKARVLDGTAEFPIDIVKSMNDARKRFDAFLAQTGAPAEARAFEAISPTWKSEARELHVIFYRRYETHDHEKCELSFTVAYDVKGAKIRENSSPCKLR